MTAEHIDYTLVDQQVPPEGEQAELEIFAPLIVAAYRRVLLSEVEELSPSQVEHALSAVKQGDRIVSARDTQNNPVGLFAYSIYTPDSHKPFYDALQAEATTHSKGVREVIDDVKQVLVANELVVGKKYHGNGLSEEMRRVALGKMAETEDTGRRIAVVGEVQSPYSVASRLRIPDSSTAWVNIPLDTSENAIPPNLLIPVADAVSRAYIASHHPSALDTYQNGTYASPEFDKPLPQPSKPFSEPIAKALQVLEERQKTAKKNEVYSGIAVTLVDFSERKTTQR